MDGTTAAVGAAAIPEQKQQISDFGRIIGVLTSPSATFADIVRKPKWITPVLLSAALGFVFAFVMNQRIDWHAFIAQQMDKSPRAADMPADQKARMVNMQANISKYFTYGIGGLGALIFPAVTAVVYLLVFNVMAGAGTNFKTSMSIVVHAFCTGLVLSPIAMLTMLLRPYGDVDPNNMVVTSVYSFLPETAPAWLQSLGSSLELFWFWTMFLLAVGFGTINKKRIGTGKAFALIAGVWMVWVFVKMGLASAFS